VGKTSLSKLLAEYVEGLTHLNLGEIINEKKLYKTWNEEFNVPEFDVDMVCDALEYISEEGGYIVDFHSSDFFPERWFDLVVLLRCNNTVLFDRLSQRNYTEKKIKENIECEIMEVTHDEVYEAYKKNIILELNNEKEEDMEKNINAIIDYLKNWEKNK